MPYAVSSLISFPYAFFKTSAYSVVYISKKTTIAPLTEIKKFCYGAVVERLTAYVLDNLITVKPAYSLFKPVTYSVIHFKVATLFRPTLIPT